MLDDYHYGPSVVAADIPIEKPIEFYVTQVILPNLFYIEEYNKKSYDSLSKMLNYHLALCGDFYKFDSIPEPGTICAALYYSDHRWYRACIISSPKPDSSIDVFYIDYGNTDSILSVDLRKLDICFAEYPSKITLVSLFGIVPSTFWSDKDILATQDFADKISKPLKGLVSVDPSIPHRRYVQVLPENQEFMTWMHQNLPCMKEDYKEWLPYYENHDLKFIRSYDLIPGYRINGGFTLTECFNNNIGKPIKYMLLDQIESSINNALIPTPSEPEFHRSPQEISLNVSSCNVMYDEHCAPSVVSIDSLNHESVVNSDEENDSIYPIQNLIFTPVTNGVVIQRRQPLPGMSVEKESFMGHIMSGKEDIHPDLFFVFPIRNRDLLYDLHESMTRVYADTCKNPTLMNFLRGDENFEVGHICCVELLDPHRRPRYYRALLLQQHEAATASAKVNPTYRPETKSFLLQLLQSKSTRQDVPASTPETRWDCFLFDIGEIVCDLLESRLHPLAPQFVNIPSLTIICRLGFLKPLESSDWPPAAICRFHDLLQRTDGLVRVSFNLDLDTYLEPVDVSLECLTDPLTLNKWCCINVELVDQGFAEVNDEFLVNKDIGHPDKVPQFNIMKDMFLRSIMAATKEKDRPVVCEFYRRKGSCMYGDSCRFIHCRLENEEIDFEIDNTLPMEPNLITMDDNDLSCHYSTLLFEEYYPVILHHVSSHFSLTATLESVLSISELTHESNVHTFKAFPQFKAQLRNHYSFKSQRDSRRPSFPVHSLVCIFVESADLYARGRVLDCDGSHIVVELVDYGAVLQLPVTAAHPLEKHFIDDCAFMGISLHLHGLVSRHNSDNPISQEDMKFAFSADRYLALVKALICDDVHVVLLGVHKDGQIYNVNKRLVERGLCSFLNQN